MNRNRVRLNGPDNEGISFQKETSSSISLIEIFPSKGKLSLEIIEEITKEKLYNNNDNLFEIFILFSKW